MRIAIAAVLGFLLVVAMEFGAWLVSSVVLTAIALSSAIPAGTGAFRMVPAILGFAMLWRTFNLMERPVPRLTLFQAASALTYHRKEMRASALSAALLMTSVMLEQLAVSAASPAPAVLRVLDVAVHVSVCFSILLLVVSLVRVHQASWFTRDQHALA